MLCRAHHIQRQGIEMAGKRLADSGHKAFAGVGSINMNMGTTALEETTATEATNSEINSTIGATHLVSINSCISSSSSRSGDTVVVLDNVVDFS